MQVQLFSLTHCKRLRAIGREVLLVRELQGAASTIAVKPPAKGQADAKSAIGSKSMLAPASNWYLNLYKWNTSVEMSHRKWWQNTPGQWILNTHLEVKLYFLEFPKIKNLMFQKFSCNSHSVFFFVSILPVSSEYKSMIFFFGIKVGWNREIYLYHSITQSSCYFKKKLISSEKDVWVLVCTLDLKEFSFSVGLSENFVSTGIWK